MILRRQDQQFHWLGNIKFVYSTKPRPGRFRALQRFLYYIQQHERVWICRRQDITDHWIAHHPHQEAQPAQEG